MSNSSPVYSFDSYINWRVNIDYYDDDAFLKAALKYFAAADWQAADTKAREISQQVSSNWRELSETSAHSVHEPSVQHYDAFNQRIDRIDRCAETLQMEKEVFSLGLFSSKTSAWEKFIQLLLIYENGESCISCPLACTDGLVALLEEHVDTPQLSRIHSHLSEGSNGHYAIAAQFLTEIQGGSDIAANCLQAIEKDNTWRLYGKKFFCSVAHADYFLVTAKPADSNRVAAFVVPAWQSLNGFAGARNLYRIDRLKPKLGTRQLPTAEISFNGAIGYPVGPVDKGIGKVISIVLGASRLTIGIFSAAIMLRAVREAHYYAEFREAFGRPIAQFPLLAAQLEEMKRQAQQTTAGVFSLYRKIQQLKPDSEDSGDGQRAIKQRRQRFELRELIMLQKIVAAADSVDLLRRAISVFGGHGVIEDFSSLPRLFRDAMVNEVWEGARNVLLTQLYRDFQQALDWYPVDQFVSNLLKHGDSFTRKQLGRDMLQIVAAPADDEVNEETIEHWTRWEKCCVDLMHAYQQQALNELNFST